MVSAGFDCMEGDPLGDFLLDREDLYAITEEIVGLAEMECGGKVVAFLEGGYDPPSLGRGAVSVIRALAGLESPDA